MKTGGFTLIELMIVVAIIGILAAIVGPKFVAFRQRANVARAASDLKTIAKGFDLYAVQNTDAHGDNRGYPDDTDLTLPAGVEDFVNEGVFLAATPFGGRYNWDGPDFYDYAGIAIQNPNGGDAIMTLVDEKLDDGNLAAGTFQKTANGRYTYLLWEK